MTHLARLARSLLPLAALGLLALGLLVSSVPVPALGLAMVAGQLIPADTGTGTRTGTITNGQRFQRGLPPAAPAPMALKRAAERQSLNYAGEQGVPDTNQAGIDAAIAGSRPALADPPVAHLARRWFPHAARKAVNAFSSRQRLFRSSGAARHRELPVHIHGAMRCSCERRPSIHLPGRQSHRLRAVC